MKRNAFTEEDFERIRALIGYRFSDTKLLATCFTHKTYSNAKGGEDNERLEFLGDAVLQLCVTEQLYLHNRNDEGKLTELRQQLVSQSALECATERAGLMPYLRYTGGEQNVGEKRRPISSRQSSAESISTAEWSPSKPFWHVTLPLIGRKITERFCRSLCRSALKRRPTIGYGKRTGCFSAR